MRNAESTRYARRACLAGLVAFGWLALGAQGAWPQVAQGEAAWRLLAQNGSVAVIRHGRTAGGAGDPQGFRLDDCATQRNLAEEGRVQSRALGERFRSHGVSVGLVLSSRWCRCLDTGMLAFGKAEPWAPLDNVFGNRDSEAAQNAEVRKRIAAWEGPGTLVLVSHGANISPLTGVYPAEGEAVVLRPNARKGFDVVGRIPSDS